VVVTRPWGYVLRTDADAIDLHRFQQLVSAAQPLPAQTRAERLAEALELWRGSPLSDAGEGSAHPRGELTGGATVTDTAATGANNEVDGSRNGTGETTPARPHGDGDAEEPTTAKGKPPTSPPANS
jgi:Bacterial transcriptional activator domain